MHGEDKGRSIALFVLVVGVLGAIAYFLLRKKKKDELLAKSASSTAAGQKPRTIREKIMVAYNKGLSTLTDAEIKKYATWIDRLEQMVLANPTGGYFTATAEAIYNANMLLGLSDDNFKAVVNYWQAVRGRNISSNAAFRGVMDESGSLPNLLFRLRDLKIIE